MDIWRGQGHANAWSELSEFWTSKGATVDATVITVESTDSAGTAYMRLHYDAANSLITKTYSAT